MINFFFVEKEKEEEREWEWDSWLWLRWYKKNKAATSNKIYATTRNDEISFIIHSLQKFFYNISSRKFKKGNVLKKKL